MKATGFMTNCDGIAKRLAKKCNDGHRHIVLVNGRAKQAAIYPEKLCRQIVKGLMEQMKTDGRLNGDEIGATRAVDHATDEWQVPPEMFWDAMTGEPLDSSLVCKARMEEMDEVRKHKIYRKVPI